MPANPPTPRMAGQMQWLVVPAPRVLALIGPTPADVLPLRVLAHRPVPGASLP